MKETKIEEKMNLWVSKAMLLFWTRVKENKGIGESAFAQYMEYSRPHDNVDKVLEYRNALDY